MHTVGNYYVENGSIVSRSTNTIIDNPACVVDMDTGGVLKVGNIAFIQNYFSETCDKLRVTGMDASLCLLVQFDKYKANMDADKVATLLNYMSNTIGPENMKALLSMDKDGLETKIKTLQEFGF